MVTNAPTESPGAQRGRSSPAMTATAASTIARPWRRCVAAAAARGRSRPACPASVRPICRRPSGGHAAAGARATSACRRSGAAVVRRRCGSRSPPPRPAGTGAAGSRCRPPRPSQAGDGRRDRRHRHPRLGRRRHAVATVRRGSRGHEQENDQSEECASPHARQRSGVLRGQVLLDAGAAASASRAGPDRARASPAARAARPRTGPRRRPPSPGTTSARGSGPPTSSASMAWSAASR